MKAFNTIATAAVMTIAVFTTPVSWAEPSDASVVTQSQLEASLAAVKNKTDVMRLARDKSRANPLAVLSPQDQEAFFKGIEYNDSGEIVSINAEVLTQALTPSQSYKVLALFGAQSLADSFNNGITKTDADAYILNAPEGCPIFTPMQCGPYFKGHICVRGVGCVETTQKVICNADTCPQY